MQEPDEVHVISAITITSIHEKGWGGELKIISQIIQSHAKTSLSSNPV